MKKIIFALGAFALMNTAAFAQTSPSEEKAKLIKDISGKTSEQLKAAGLDETTTGKFIDCYEKDLDAKLDLEDLKVMVALTSLEEGETPSEELIGKAQGLQSKAADLGKECASLLGM
jgi:hypothetical protein